MTKLTGPISVALMALIASVQCQTGKYDVMYTYGKTDMFDQETQSNNGKWLFQAAIGSSRTSEGWSKYELLTSENRPCPKDSEKCGDFDQHIDALIQWTWQTDTGSEYSESAIIKFDFGRVIIQEIVPGLIDPRGEITESITDKLEWQDYIFDRDHADVFTVDDISGPSGTDFSYSEYVYRIPSSDDDGKVIQWDNEGGRLARFYLHRPEPVSRLNKLSVGFFFYEWPQSAWENDLKWVAYEKARKESRENPPSQSQEEETEATPWFINVYGYDQLFVQIMFYSGLFLNLIPVASLPLASIPMIWLMLYQLLHPLVFRSQYPDLAQWDDIDYLQDVVFYQFGISFLTYNGMAIAYFPTIIVIIVAVTLYLTVDGFTTDQVQEVLGYYTAIFSVPFQLIVSFLALLVGFFPYGYWA